MTPPNGNVRVLCWSAGAVMFLLSVFGTGYVYLDSKKAERVAVEAMAQDIRELRVFFLGPKR